ncbi:amidohydrolase [Pacificoceanicola onchidii]|uniref:amidohydrolase n=1 Tax=Pacificoceanicola onchidii TaxID=2562685 RepID=UPI001F111DCB|nr:amidohydrolase [Pacificoceanicola onchidii]
MSLQLQQSWGIVVGAADGGSMVGNTQLAELTAWRRGLHQRPEVSGEERETAAEVARMLQAAGADKVLERLGGYGVAGVFDSGAPGPRVMLRCELDALPIEETSQVPHVSTVPGKAHLCGHDGHMAILAAVAARLARARPERGAVILMFQPAEETGQGARAVLADPAFAALAPTHVFAIHNMPGLPLGAVAVKSGPVTCASRGMRIAFHGKTSHAAEPEKARSPRAALARLMLALPDLAEGAPGDPDYALVTVTHASMGARAFGITPGAAELLVTLRSLTDARMARLQSEAEAQVRSEAADAGLVVTVTYEDVFGATENDPEAARIVTEAAQALGLEQIEGALPWRASEDVGCFGDVAPLGFFLLGAGEAQPPLHAPNYDFPDALIGRGADILCKILARIAVQGAGQGEEITKEQSAARP